MKITLIAVSSLDGKITKWDDSQDVSSWASPEDQEFFVSMIQKHKVLVMGRKSYDAVKHRLKLDENRLRIVMTSTPEKYKCDVVPGKLEFTSESPVELVHRLESEDNRELLLLGGSGIYTAFLKAGLVSDLYLTLEPKIFGKGKLLVGEERLDFNNLNLESVEKLNRQGSLLLHYLL